MTGEGNSLIGGRVATQESDQLRSHSGGFAMRQNAPSFIANPLGCVPGAARSELVGDRGRTLDERPVILARRVASIRMRHVGIDLTAAIGLADQGIVQ